MSAPTVGQGGRPRRSSRSGFTGQPDRLPAPTRERRPALAALAVLLIVGGALLSALIVLRSGHRNDYLVVTKNVPAGQVVKASDLGTVSLAGDVGAIPAVNRSRFVGSYAANQLHAGELPVRDEFLAQPLAAPGSAVVGVLLADGNRPSETLEAGNVVGLYAVPSGGQGGATTATELIRAVRIVDVQNASSGGIGSSSGLYVSLLVPSAKAGDVTFAAVNKELSVVLLPSDTTPDIDFAAPGSAPVAAAPPTAAATTTVPAAAPAPTTTAAKK